MVAQLSYQSPWVSLALESLELDSNTHTKNGFITEKFLVVISNQLLSCRIGHGTYTVGAKQFCKVDNVSSTATEMRLYSRTTATTFTPCLGAIDTDPRNTWAEENLPQQRYQQLFVDFHQRVEQHQRKNWRHLYGHVPWVAAQGQGRGKFAPHDLKWCITITPSINFNAMYLVVM